MILRASGGFVTTLERAGSIDHPGQCATAIYEFTGDLIHNTWYYAAHDCGETSVD